MNKMQANGKDSAQAAPYRYIYLFLLGALVLLALLFAVSGSLDMVEDFAPPERVNWLYLGLALASNLAFWLATAVSWQVAIHRITAVRMSILYSFAQVALVMVGKYLPGKVWGLAMRGKDMTNLGISHYQVLVCSQVEQVVSIHAGLSIGAAGWLALEQPPYWQLALVVVGLVPFAGSFLNNTGMGWVARVLGKVWPSLQLSDHKISAPTYLVLFVLYLVEWVTVGAILYFLWLAVFEPVLDPVMAAHVIAANAVAFLVGFVAVFAPGGVGIREGVLVSLLAASLGLPEAIYISVLFRIWLVITDGVAGLLSLKIIGSNARTGA